jgi:MFS family permease
MATASPQSPREVRIRLAFGVTNIVVALAILFCVFTLLPTRWWPVDLGALIVGGLMGSSGVTLVRAMPQAEKLTRYAAFVILGIGVILITAIFGTAGWISGVYGQVGSGGAVVFALVGLLATPYVVVLPVAELVWLGPRAMEAKKQEQAEKKAEEEAEEKAEKPTEKSKADE